MWRNFCNMIWTIKGKFTVARVLREREKDLEYI